MSQRIKDIYIYYLFAQIILCGVLLYIGVDGAVKGFLLAGLALLLTELKKSLTKQKGQIK